MPEIAQTTYVNHDRVCLKDPDNEGGPGIVRRCVHRKIQASRETRDYIGDKYRWVDLDWFENWTEYWLARKALNKAKEKEENG